MKTNILIRLITASVIFFAVTQQTTAQEVSTQQTAAEISFTYTRLSGNGSNQFAVWVEDAEGKLIKTLYATRFTANGGWQRRANSLPMWVQKAEVANLTKDQVDTVSGATPRTGNLSYSWDGTNNAGRPVPDGEYVIVLEGTLRNNNQVYYRAFIRLGQGAATADVNVEYIGNAGNDRSMLDDVIIRALR